MSNRPGYVAVIGWALVAIGALSIVSVAAGLAVPSVRAGLAAGPMPLALAAFLNLASSLLELVCGLYILKGANWARMVYLLLCIASGVYLFLSGTVDTTLVVIWLVVVVLTLAGLFTPAASRFFAGPAATEEGAPA